MTDFQSPLAGLSQREPPANIEAEQSLLGAILANNKAFDRVAHFLKPEHFADSMHGRLYAECGRLITEGNTADPVTLRQFFAAQPDVEDYNGIEYLADLLSAMVGIVNAGDYGRSIQEAWARRQMIDIAEDLVNTAFGPGKKTTLEIVASTIGQLESTLVRHGDETDVKLADAVAKVIDAMQNAMAGEVPRIYSTGIPDLDGIIGGGLRPADLIVLGGRPGHGKSALATQISAAFCQRYSLPVYFFTMEMTSDQQAARILSQMSGISTDRIELGQISTNEAEKLVKAQRDLAELKVYFDDRPRLDVPQLRLAVRRFKRRYGKPGLIVVDHMHLMRVQQADMKLGLPFAIGQLANSLKEIAKEEDCPMVALAQLNRSKESSDDKVPTMADLKSSGDIEAAADVVLFTHRAELHMHKAKPTRKPGESDSEYQNREQQYQQALADVRGKVELVSAKVRKGATSAIEMRFDGPTTTFLTVS